MSLLFSSAGDVLLYLTLHPGCTPREAQQDLQINPPKLYGILQELRAAGLVTTEEGEHNGRKRGYAPYHCYVDLDVPFLHPCLSQPTTLRKALAFVALQEEI